MAIRAPDGANKTKLAGGPGGQGVDLQGPRESRDRLSGLLPSGSYRGPTHKSQIWGWHGDVFFPIGGYCCHKVAMRVQHTNLGWPGGEILECFV